MYHHRSYTVLSNPDKMEYTATGQMQSGCTVKVTMSVHVSTPDYILESKNKTVPFHQTIVFGSSKNNSLYWCRDIHNKDKQ